MLEYFSDSLTDGCTHAEYQNLLLFVVTFYRVIVNFCIVSSSSSSPKRFRIDIQKTNKKRAKKGTEETCQKREKKKIRETKIILVTSSKNARRRESWSIETLPVSARTSKDPIGPLRGFDNPTVESSLKSTSRVFIFLFVVLVCSLPPQNLPSQCDFLGLPLSRRRRRRRGLGKSERRRRRAADERLRREEWQKKTRWATKQAETPSPTSPSAEKSAPNAFASNEEKEKRRRRKKNRKQQCEQLYQWLTRVATNQVECLSIKTIIDDQGKCKRNNWNEGTGDVFGIQVGHRRS